MGYIYKITGPTGKSYVGKTIQKLEVRMKQHADPRTCCRALKEGFDELGIENFTYEVLWEGDNSQLGAMEKQFIASEDTMYPNGYNLRTGGGRSERVSEQSRRGMVEKQREIRRRKNGGLLGYIVKESDKTWRFQASINGKTRRFPYCTEKDARQAQVRYSQDPDNFDPDAPTHKQVHRNHGTSVYFYNDRWIFEAWVDGKKTGRRFKTETEARAFQGEYMVNPGLLTRTTRKIGCVYEFKGQGKWGAKIGKNYLGRFTTREEAEKALDETLKECALT